MVYGEDAIPQMAAQYERFFERGERYAVISTNRSGAENPSAKARRAIADWAGSPRVKKAVSQLCVGSATVARGTIERGALTAIFWLWRPPCPYQISSTHDEAVDWAVEQLVAASVELPLGAAGTRNRARELLRRL